ncbi:unnamed protein product [Heligmosomoides polygyrus]|uniref:Reverse transcriptase domain-containing protein n=1 Tax=Heligmosomoides polygyrus TaxID=6339 RepID=A0A183GA67_HELPZ|nr:unnamed protein product [Heligmosomoides polygyrus]
MDRIRNDVIRQKFGVALIAYKIREARLRWYGHVLRGKEDSVRKIGLKLEVSGKQPRGHPKQRWTDTAGSGKMASCYQKSGPRYEAGQTRKKKKKKKKKASKDGLLLLTTLVTVEDLLHTPSNITSNPEGRLICCSLPGSKTPEANNKTERMNDVRQRKPSAAKDVGKLFSINL